MAEGWSVTLKVVCQCSYSQVFVVNYLCTPDPTQTNTQDLGLNFLLILGGPSMTILFIM